MPGRFTLPRLNLESEMTTKGEQATGVVLFSNLTSGYAIIPITVVQVYRRIFNRLPDETHNGQLVFNDLRAFQLILGTETCRNRELSTEIITDLKPVIF